MITMMMMMMGRHVIIPFTSYITQETNVFLRYETTLMRTRVFGNQPTLTMTIGDPDDLTLDEGEFVFIFAREVEEGDSFAVHFFVGRGDGKLIASRISSGGGGVFFVGVTTVVVFVVVVVIVVIVVVVTTWR